MFLLVFLPLLGAVVAHAPVLSFDLLPSLRRPIDGGRTFRGRRLLGDNKTWRGAIVMFAGIVVATLVLSLWPAYWNRLPAGIQQTAPVLFALLLATGTVAAELPNSFLKRQLGVPPGRQVRSRLGVALSMLDQGDVVIGVWIALLPVWAMTVPQALLAFTVVGVVHLGVNVVGYSVGAKEVPI
jgi:CDP-2,3-bis-(O-geranylgeranyl)-sn-glycerol synthase